MKKKNKSTLIWLVAAVAIVAGSFGIYRLASSPQGLDNNSGGGNGASAILAARSDDWSKGDEDAKAVLIEYSDFQCPACAGFAPVVSQISQEFGDDLKVIYRHFPLFQSHPNAISAAQAAEAAGKQGKFWQMHDMIFVNQSKWANSGKAKDIFKEYAASLELDEARFAEDLKSKEVNSAIKDDLGDAQQLRLTYTPTFILNGKIVQNPRSHEEFRSLISQAILESQN